MRSGVTIASSRVLAVDERRLGGVCSPLLVLHSKA